MKTKSSILGMVFVLGALAFSAACGGGSGGSDDTVTGNVGTANGTIRAADGSPVAGASVALSSGGSSNLTKAAMKNANGRYARLSRETDDEGDECDDISSSISGTLHCTDCTDGGGGWVCSGSIPCGTPITITVRVGSFFLEASLTLLCPADSDGDGELNDETAEAEDDTELSEDCGQDDDEDEDEDEEGDEDEDDEEDEDEEGDEDEDDDEDDSVSALTRNGDDDSCEFDAADMAVVTGSFDEIENVLAKLGFGTVDEVGLLDEDKPYDFDLIDGVFDSTELEELLSSVDNMNAYDIIFFNCGNNFEDDLLSDANVLANIQEYVDGGGKLYVTDWSYDFVEQSFPSFMDFLNGGSTATLAETKGDAEEGTSGISSDATVNDVFMAEWLDGVTVNTGSIDVECSALASVDDINGTIGARNDDGTVTIADFLAAWAVMSDPHTGESPTIWISGPIEFSGGSDMDAPLTVTKDQGLGRILYSSYHTAHSCPTIGFWPQERILQYLVFKL